MKTYTYNELKDSKIIYDKNPPKFMPIVIIIILALISALVLISLKTNKTYIVKGQGIVSSDSKQYIMSAVSGEIILAEIKEGQSVKEGDVMAIIKSPDLNLQKQQLEQQIKMYEEKINLLQRLESDINNYKNSFDKNNPTEAEYYNRLQSMYASQKEYNINSDDLKKQGYTDDQIKMYVDNGNLKKEQIRVQNLENISKEKSQYITEKQKLEIQLSAIGEGKNEYIITASKSGTVHLLTPISKGMVIQAGNAIGTISDSQDIYFETYISSADRARINVGEKVSITVNGLIQNEYGVVNGTVIEIDSDATVDQNNGNVMFKVKVKPNENYLKDKKDKKVFLTLGMTAEVRIKYDKVTYFKYIIDALGINV
jgi:multidrug resistance efflux pump